MILKFYRKFIRLLNYVYIIYNIWIVFKITDKYLCSRALLLLFIWRMSSSFIFIYYLLLTLYKLLKLSHLTKREWIDFVIVTAVVCHWFRINVIQGLMWHITWLYTKSLLYCYIKSVVCKFFFTYFLLEHYDEVKKRPWRYM